MSALYGHSVPVDLGLKCKVPPVQLYHGTSTKASIDILEYGILPMSRNFVHLTDDKDIAIEVGRHHGNQTAVVLRQKPLFIQSPKLNDIMPLLNVVNLKSN